MILSPPDLVKIGIIKTKLTKTKTKLGTRKKKLGTTKYWKSRFLL